VPFPAGYPKLLTLSAAVQCETLCAIGGTTMRVEPERERGEGGKPRIPSEPDRSAIAALPSSSYRELQAINKPEFSVRAFYVGEHIDLRLVLKTSRTTAQQPALVPMDGGGVAVLFRYGAVVFFDATDSAQQAFLRELAPLIAHRYEQPESEEVLIRISAHDRESAENATVVVNSGSNERLEVVAAVLGKSVALAQYEADVANNFDQIEPFAKQLESTGRGGRKMRQLLRQIGRTLLNEHKMVARVEVVERPDLLWERPELEQLYLRLEDEFELRERAAILDRKLDLISRTASTVLDLLQKRRSLRVEWYIVLLIVFEIALSLYSLIGRGL
jgi:uncharacterized Rmd1/YagE family protein